jgi:hypothetical protein
LRGECAEPRLGLALIDRPLDLPAGGGDRPRLAFGEAVPLRLAPLARAEPGPLCRLGIAEEQHVLPLGVPCRA